MSIYDYLDGIIPIAGGIYCGLLAYGIWPPKEKDSEKMRLWRKRFGKEMRYMSPALIVVGIILLSLNLLKIK